MHHPFTRMFDKALHESTPTENLVLKEAERLKEKGYAAKEIHDVLKRLHKGLLDDVESEIAGEAAEEFSRYL